jgi:hypothetical protein
VGFTQLDFYPSIVAPFLQKLTHKVFVEGYSVDRMVGRLLLEEITLGRNTSVAVMNGTQGWAWFLCSNEHGRPLGLSFSIQCVNCGRLKGITIVKHSPFNQYATCKICKYQKKLQVPHNNFYTKEVLDGKDGWGIQVLWGEQLFEFPGGKKAICLDDWEDEVRDQESLARIAARQHLIAQAEELGDVEGQTNIGGQSTSAAEDLDAEGEDDMVISP